MAKLRNTVERGMGGDFSKQTVTKSWIAKLANLIFQLPVR